MNVTDIVVLDEIDMMLHRPDTFVGAVEQKVIQSYIFEESGATPKFRTIAYSPALLKLFDEVLQNCYDHSKRPGGKHLNRVDVTVQQMTGLISVADNAGIPVEMHPEYKMFAPCIIFGMLRSSTNYNDSEQREGGGRNGLGAKLTNIFSTMFKVETCDGKNKYEKTYSNNRRDETDPKVSGGKNRGTKISFIPDYDRLGLKGLDDDNYGMIITRVYEIAACSPHIDFYLNGKKIDVKGFEQFAKKFGSDGLFTENEHWRVGIHHSDEGFKHISFCNATHTWLGGNHVEYIANQLVEGVREHVKKKTKQDVKPADIRNHFFLMVDATVYNPRFSSQTKEHMNLAVSSFGTGFKIDDKFIAKMLKSKIVQEIIEWAINKKKLQDMADLKKMSKDVQKATHKNIQKYEPASQKVNRHECTLFVCEGDSAANPLISARDPKKHGVFALRGKPLNMGHAKPEEIKKNEEIQNLMAALGIGFNDLSGLRYGRVVFATDADMDGMHIRALGLNNFYHYWIDLLMEDRVYYLHTPIVRIIKGKDKLEFFTMVEYEKWQAKNPTGKYEVQYLKGLGGHSTSDFKKYMFEEKYIVPLEFKDDDTAAEMLELAFGEADNKKEWLGLE